MTQAPTPGPLMVGDYAVRLEDHPLVKSGEVHRVTEMFRGGYLGFARPVGGEWNPSGWRKCDADGWMPWSGGENPVGDAVVEIKLRNNATSTETASGFPWSHDECTSYADIIAFRLAPTAPVEASGSERERLARAIDPYAWDDAQYAEPGGKGQQWSQEAARKAADRVLALRPQPSGETRKLLERAAAIADDVERGKRPKLEAVDMIRELRNALLSARPLALGGQQGGKEKSQ